MRLQLALATCCLFLVLTAGAIQNETSTTPETATTPETSTNSASSTTSTLPGTPEIFPLAERCAGCHDNIEAEDDSRHSYVADWHQNVHSQSSLDPLFLAVARTETLILPEASEEIQGVCASCHLPMADLAAQSQGTSRAFLDKAALSDDELYALYAEGDSCMICHQLTTAEVPGNESYRESLFSINLSPIEPDGMRTLYSFYDLGDEGKAMMERALGYESAQEKEIHQNSICSPCHTLYTDSFSVEGEPTGIQLPEQVTMMEWDSSGYGNPTCQSCHMPLLTRSGVFSNREVADAVVGQVRAHTFLGANSYLLRLNNDEQGFFDQGIEQTEEFLQTQTAYLGLNRKVEENPDGSGLLALDVRISSMVNHKFPTGFPSRRAWIHVKVLDEAGNIIYESGAYDDEGKILDNDGDLQKGEFEPHYDIIDQPGQVQIYEAVMIDSNGKATTYLLQGVYYGKDNRLLSTGFDKSVAPDDCAVMGDAKDDGNFTAGKDTVHYRITLPEGTGEVTIEVELLYQTVGYRFLKNLEDYPSAEQQALAELLEDNPNTPSLITSKTVTVNR